MLGAEITGLWCDYPNRKKHRRPYEPPFVVRKRNVERNRVKSRRRLLKTFWRWYAKNKHRFQVEIEVQQRLDWCLIFNFVGFNPEIWSRLSSSIQEWEVWVDNRFEGDRDNPENAWAWPKSIAPGKYIDSSLLEEYQVVRNSREEIWEIGIFEDFLRWINEDLVRARWVEIRGQPNRWSNAKFIFTDEKCEDVVEDDCAYTYYIPCRV